MTALLRSTTNEIPGREIANVLDVVMGNTVHSKHMGRDFMAGLKGMIGGEIKGYTQMMTQARNQALERMEQEAARLGADAVIGFRFASSSIGSEMCEVLAYGTAVKLR